MTGIEDLVRHTFTDREADLAGAAPSYAAVRDRARARARRRVTAAAGSVAVVAVLAGGTVALTRVTGPDATVPAAAPTVAPGTLPPYLAVRIVSSPGRTGATLGWTPTWLPPGIRETGRMAGNTLQLRAYGRNGGPVVRIASTLEGCGTPRELEGDPGTPITVAGRPALLWAFARPPEYTAGYLPPATGAGHLVCVPVPGGGYYVQLSGTADTAADAERVAASIRRGGPVEIAVRLGATDYPGGVAVGSDAAGRPLPFLRLGNADARLEPLDPAAPPPNTTVDGRPAHLESSARTGAVLTVPLRDDLQAVFTANYPDLSVAENERAVRKSPRGLTVGPAPDYGWLG